MEERGGISPGPISGRGWRSEVGREVEGVVDGKEMGDDCHVVDALGVPVDMVRHRATMSFRALLEKNGLRPRTAFGTHSKP